MEEGAGAAIFAPDTLLASQYFDRVRSRAARDGERRLMVAVLEDAVDVYLKHANATDPRRQELFREAEDWIEEHDVRRFYSFENICAVLDLEADYIRHGLRAWRERERRGGRKAAAGPADGSDETLRRASGE